MKNYKYSILRKKRLADLHTPVNIYLKVRDKFANSFLLESSDYSSNENSYSFICVDPVAEFSYHNGNLTTYLPNGEIQSEAKSRNQILPLLKQFFSRFETDSETDKNSLCGFFGYNSYDSVQNFETIRLKNKIDPQCDIPELRYQFFRFIISINHFNNELSISENLMNDQSSRIDEILRIIENRNIVTYGFVAGNSENENISSDEFLEMVRKGKEHCFRGDVFQLVLSRRFSRGFQGDEFNVYRALRSVNPSPYLFYFDYGTYKLFGSSPEAQITVTDTIASINPIAGTFKRAGDELADSELAEKLKADPKENSEHVMLVDLARNDLSRNSEAVKVEKYREVQFFSHVIHLVSKVTAKLYDGVDGVQVMADTFPAGTLSGAPKYRAMELIDQYEPEARSFYGGSIGYIGVDGSVNQAIIIRSFLSHSNRLYYQAGAGVVAGSDEVSELNEVDNKLGALRKAIVMAEKI